MTRKDRWYWVRYKFGTTVTPAKPATINYDKITSWWLPFMASSGFDPKYQTELAKEIEIICEIPFPDEMEFVK